VYLGLLLLSLGTFVSPAVLEMLILPEGSLVGTRRRILVWVVCRVLMAGAGAYLLIRRPRFTAVHLAAFIFGSVITIFCTAVFFQFVYVPPRLESGWRAFAPKSEQNQSGFRGRPFVYSQDDFVVVLLGDSQVEAMALPFESMPEQLLESELNSDNKSFDNKKVKVFSLGAGGYGQDQELFALQEYFRKFRADLVVLWETPNNDVWNNVFPTHMASFNPKPTYWLQDGRLQGPTESWGQPLPYSRFAVWALWQRLHLDFFQQRDKEWERRLPPPYRPIEHYAGNVNREWQDRWDTNLARMRDENIENEKTGIAMTLSPRSERTQYGLDLTRGLLKRIEEAANSKGGKLVLFQAEANRLRDEDEMYVLNSRYYLVSKKQYLANLSYLNQGFQSEAIPITVKDWRVGPDNAHLNLRANEQVMKDLAIRLRLRKD
jgi:hypothetical protein